MKITKNQFTIEEIVGRLNTEKRHKRLGRKVSEREAFLMDTYKAGETFIADLLINEVPEFIFQTALEEGRCHRLDGTDEKADYYFRVAFENIETCVDNKEQYIRERRIKDRIWDFLKVPTSIIQKELLDELYVKFKDDFSQYMDGDYQLSLYLFKFADAYISIDENVEAANVLKDRMEINKNNLGVDIKETLKKLYGLVEEKGFVEIEVNQLIAESLENKDYMSAVEYARIISKDKSRIIAEIGINDQKADKHQKDYLFINFFETEEEKQQRKESEKPLEIERLNKKIKEYTDKLNGYKGKDGLGLIADNYLKTGFEDVDEPLFKEYKRSVDKFIQKAKVNTENDNLSGFCEKAHLVFQEKRYLREAMKAYQQDLDYKGALRTAEKLGDRNEIAFYKTIIALRRN